MSNPDLSVGSPNDLDWADELAAEVVDKCQAQNWKLGGALTLDRPDAIAYVAGCLRRVQALTEPRRTALTS